MCRNTRFLGSWAVGGDGGGRTQVELEDRAFRILNPVAYTELQRFARAERRRASRAGLATERARLELEIPNRLEGEVLLNPLLSPLCSLGSYVPTCSPRLGPSLMARSYVCHACHAGPAGFREVG